MKRLNPKTGKEFIFGDVRDDGYIFRTYRTNTKKQDGTFQEVWYSPESWHRATKDAVERTNRKTQERRKWIRKYKLERGCADCGYRDNAAALQFDHLPGHKKEFRIAENTNTNIDALKAEIAKCEVVCANCHCIRTEQRRLNDVRQVQSI